MNTRLSKLYAAVCTLLLTAGLFTVFFFAWTVGLDDMIECIGGVVASLAIAPIFHELGHITFAKAGDMQIVYAKFFCFKLVEKNGKLRYGFASPFAHDQTQVVPKTGGNMLSRAKKYTIGGLVFSGALLLIITAGAVVCACVGAPSFELLGSLPYIAYLFLLNAVPAYYASGKTDAAVYIGLKKGYAQEKNMLAAMEIQGRLYEGESFGEIDEELYTSAPQLCEDEPLYAVMLDLKYRYYLEKERFDDAADALNRLVKNQAYLSAEETEKIAAELVYMHAINGDIESAEKSANYCKDFLSGDSAQAKRALAAVSAAVGKTEEAEILINQAHVALQNERIKGVAKGEEILLSRITVV
ncbi:MAG: hypothetical protein IJA89_04620 [Clostridia bacterium]|nr:hypothetical protein [Clostridia bacterium]